MYRDERNITIYTDSSYQTYRIYGNVVKLPLDDCCKDHTGSFELVIHSKLSDMIFKKQMLCKASIVEEITGCYKDPFNYRCAKVFSKIISFFLFTFVILAFTIVAYLIVLFLCKIYYLFYPKCTLANEDFYSLKDRLAHLESMEQSSLIENKDKEEIFNSYYNKGAIDTMVSSINERFDSLMLTLERIDNEVKESNLKVIQLFSQIESINDYHNQNKPVSDQFINGTNESIQHIYSDLGQFKSNILGFQQRIMRIESLINYSAQSTPPFVPSSSSSPQYNHSQV